MMTFFDFIYFSSHFISFLNFPCFSKTRNATKKLSLILFKLFTIRLCDNWLLVKNNSSKNLKVTFFALNTFCIGVVFRKIGWFQVESFFKSSRIVQRNFYDIPQTFFSSQKLKSNCKNKHPTGYFKRKKSSCLLTKLSILTYHVRFKTYLINTAQNEIVSRSFFEPHFFKK